MGTSERLFDVFVLFVVLFERNCCVRCSVRKLTVVVAVLCAHRVLFAVLFALPMLSGLNLLNYPSSRVERFV